MVPADRQRQVALPEKDQPVRLFFTVLINTEIDTGGKGVDVLRYFTVRVKRFCIRQIIHKPYKFRRHFVGTGSMAVLHGFPPFPVFFYKSSFTHLARYCVRKIRIKRKPCI
jgi:hypothetical protein